eukprot:5462887-Ditylum_brightwellii.AAC.1
MDLYWHKLCTSMLVAKNSKQGQCNTCGGTDHLRKLPHQCSLNPINTPTKVPAKNKSEKSFKKGEKDNPSKLRQEK